MVPMTPAELLESFTTQVRLTDRDAVPGHIVERDGPVHRSYPGDPGQRGAMIECPEGLGEDPEHWIARQVAFFSGRGQRVEWKTYSTDPVPRLQERLSAARFVAEEVEVLMLGELRDLDHDVALPEGIALRDIESDEDWRRVGRLMDGIWGTDAAWVNDHLRAEQRQRPDLMVATVVEQDSAGAALAYALLRFTEGTDFCGLWGGSTDPRWRGRGFYRALLAHRARIALERGSRYARVDTSPDSRPILTRLGLHQVATTTPYVLTPA